MKRDSSEPARESKAKRRKQDNVQEKTQTSNNSLSYCSGSRLEKFYNSLTSSDLDSGDDSKKLRHDLRKLDKIMVQYSEAETRYRN